VEKNYDVIIVGAGMVGLVLAAALSQEQFSVAVVETQKIVLGGNDIVGPEVSSIHNSSQQILQNLNVWSLIRPSHRSALRKIVAYDNEGGAQIEFDSTELGKAQLGFIVDNHEIRHALYQKLEHTGVKFYSPAKPRAIDVQATQVTFQLDDEMITAQLLVGADGVNSWVREHMRIACSKRPYDQDAIIANVHVELPHQETAYQHFLATGPVALLPQNLPHQMTLIWSANTEYAESLMLMPRQNFQSQLTRVFKKSLGNIELLSECKKLTLVEQRAEQMIHDRIALVGDAAHRIHPLAGQGVNLGFLDAACLAQTLTEARNKSQDLGGVKALRRYERWRHFDNQAMLYGMRFFKEIFGVQNPMMVTVRGIGMNAVDRLPFLKKCLMKYATGNLEDLPELAK
jgi:2-octaprenylphenol hydroxylase